MKKFICTAFVFLVIALTGVSARNLKVGASGGANFSQTGAMGVFKGDGFVKSATSYQVGALVQEGFGKYFTMQTGAMYNSKSSKLIKQATGIETEMNLGYVEVPLAVQFGIDLQIIRPFISAGIFGGYLVRQKNVEVPLNKWEFGAKAGAGIQLWIFQVSAHYNWNFIPMTPNDKSSRLNMVDVTLSIFI